MTGATETGSVTPTALTIAGSDSGGGAGIQADLKTFAAAGVYGCSAITAITAQNTRAVTGAWPQPPGSIRQQITTVLDDIAIHSVKTGMLFDQRVIEEVLEGLADYPDLPLVCDPVMVSTSGDRLLDEAAVDALRYKLFPRAALITPNLREAAALLDAPLADTEQQIIDQAEQLLEFGVPAVLVTGGDFADDRASDVFVRRGGGTQSCEIFRTDRVATRNTHGTGCTLSAAIAAGLAKGLALQDAIGQAKEYIAQALNHADTLNIGKGHGPLHHFY